MLKVSNNLMMLSIMNNLFNQCCVAKLWETDMSLQGISSTTILVQKELIASLNLACSKSRDMAAKIMKILRLLASTSHTALGFLYRVFLRSRWIEERLVGIWDGIYNTSFSL
jgi:hypothetical protein